MKIKNSGYAIKNSGYAIKNSGYGVLKIQGNRL